MIHIDGEPSISKFIFRRVSIFFGWWLLLGSLLGLYNDKNLELPVLLLINIFTLILSSIGLYYIHKYKYTKLKIGSIFIYGIWILLIISVLFELLLL